MITLNWQSKNHANKTFSQTKEKWVGPLGCLATKPQKFVAERRM